MKIKTITICVLLGLVVITRAQGPAAPEPGLLAAIRAGNNETVARLLRAGADVNTRDETGATALMHAAAFASTETLSLLVRDGANVNATNEAGATALMWATHDADKVRLLLERGAEVNVEGPNGTTALLSAALRGKSEVMRMLISAGADLQKGTVLAPWPMRLSQILLTTNDPAMRQFFDASEATPQKLAAWSPPPMMQWFLASVFSWRPQPAVTQAGVAKALLDAGADPNEAISQLTLTAPVLTHAARFGEVDTMRALLDGGADPNSKGPQGLTPLMMAAAMYPNEGMVRLLLEMGAKVDARDNKGNTALDWALRLGETDASRVLRGAGAVAMAPPVVPPAAVSTPREPRAAIEMAISRLQPAGPELHAKTKCISCHHQSLPAVAVKLSDTKGVRIDRALSSHPTQATLEVWTSARERMMLGNCAVFGFVPNAAYGLFGMAEEGVTPNPATDAVTSCLAGLQKPDGSWESGDVRPPLSGRNPFVYTALAIRGLMLYSPPARRDDVATRVERALQFLRTATPADTQEEAFRLLGLVWARAPRAEVASQSQRVRALQRADGSWGQWPSMASDAYATGQALYALQVSGESASSTSYRRGSQYLLRTQLADGTWYVRSRAIGFQPYVESRFPHGPDQFISAAATAWAVMALTHVL